MYKKSSISAAFQWFYLIIFTSLFIDSIQLKIFYLVKINLKQTKGGDLSLRTVVNLPNGSGKKSKVAVLCEADKVDEAKKSGADIVGSEDLLEKISTGKFNFTKKSNLHLKFFA